MEKGMSPTQNSTQNSKVEGGTTDAMTSFPIVGIGASAGGLEALESFLVQIPIDSDMSFVIVQHQDPTHKGMMVELLQKHSLLPIYTIEDKMQVQPNSIYFVPPGFDVSIRNNILHLHEPNAPRGLRLPIDFFFQSLAEDKKHNSIGVILSGMGSDGTFGLRAIKEQGGAVFVQEPSSAKFDAMPRSAINAGLADVVAPAEALADKIITYLQHLPSITTELKLKEADQGAIEKILLLLNVKTGHNFSLYKRNTLYRRIERRMGVHQLSSINDYLNYLSENSQEITLLFKELLIGVTHFFRDPAVWEQLKKDIMHSLFSNYPNGGTLRAWVVGCSTGEEAYSLAIIFKESVEEIRPHKEFSLKIFATDLDKDTITKARMGSFPHNISADVGEERLSRFFTEEENGYRVNKEIREMVIFAPHNVIMDSPFTKLDILTCRNLLIYLNVDLQKKLLNLFHYSLNSSGVLMLGSAETIGNLTHLFAPFPGKTRLFRRLEVSRELRQVEFPTIFQHHLSELSMPVPPQTKLRSSLPNLKILIESLLLQVYSPAAVLVTTQGDILYISGKTGKYLEPATGKANLNLFAMAREGLKQAISESFQKAVRQQQRIILKGVKIKADGNFYGADVTIHPLEDRQEFKGMLLVVFNEIAPPKDAQTYKTKSGKMKSDRIASLIEELEYSQKALQINRQEMQNSQEELKSTNEELQSTNEELQSTNEELTTSKEEMQSMNEELQTINNELQAKLDELARTSNDMHNLLNSTDIAILFLDEDLRVRRFTNQVTNIFKLISSDTGRQITDLVSDLEYPTLAKDAREVLRTLVFKETQVPTHDNRWYIVRIMPYRTLENRIDGLVITFTDITVAKKLELKLRNRESNLKNDFNIHDEKDS